MDCNVVLGRVRELLTGAADEVVCAYLFGSVSRGEASTGSDVDLAILLDRPAEGRLTDLRFALEATIERETGSPTQVVVLNDAPPDLVHRVLRDGKLLLDRDPSERLQFEVRARNEYFDLLPTLQLYRRTGSHAP